MTSARTAARRATGGARPAPHGGRRLRTRPVTRRRPAGSSLRRATGAGTRRQRSRPNWWPLGLIAFALLLVLAWQVDATPAPAAPARCTVPGTDVSLSGEQAANARAIAATARKRKLPERALVIALATAQQESKLRNLHYGDRDSLGLFQQRPSQGWGTPAQVLDPDYAAGKFFDRLVQVPGWQSAPLADAAQAVQRSAAPGAYQRWEPMATQLAAALDSPGGAALRCG